MSEEKKNPKEKPTKKQQQQEEESHSSDEEELASIIQKKAEKSIDQLMQHMDPRVNRHIERVDRYLEYLEDRESDHNVKNQTLIRKIRALNTRIAQIKEAAQCIEPKDEWDNIRLPLFVSKSMIESAIRRTMEVMEVKRIKEKEERHPAHSIKKKPLTAKRRKEEEEESTSGSESESDQPKKKKPKGRQSLPPPSYDPLLISDQLDPNQVLTEDQVRKLKDHETVKVRLCLGRYADHEPCIWSEETSSHNTASHWRRNHHASLTASKEDRKKGLPKQKYTYDAWMKKQDWLDRKKAASRQAVEKRNKLTDQWNKQLSSFMNMKAKELIKRYTLLADEEEIPEESTSKQQELTSKQLEPTRKTPASSTAPNPRYTSTREEEEEPTQKKKKRQRIQSEKSDSEIEEIEIDPAEKALTRRDQPKDKNPDPKDKASGPAAKEPEKEPEPREKNPEPLEKEALPKEKTSESPLRSAQPPAGKTFRRKQPMGKQPPPDYEEEESSSSSSEKQEEQQQSAK